MKLNKKHPKEKHCKDFAMESQVHFAISFFGRFMKCISLEELARDTATIMTSKFVTKDTRKVISNIEDSINNFESSNNITMEELNETGMDHEDDDNKMFPLDDTVQSTSGRNLRDNKNAPKSEFHAYWDLHLPNRNGQ